MGSARQSEKERAPVVGQRNGREGRRALPGELGRNASWGKLGRGGGRKLGLGLVSRGAFPFFLFLFYFSKAFSKDNF